MHIWVSLAAYENIPGEDGLVDYGHELFPVKCCPTSVVYMHIMSLPRYGGRCMLEEAQDGLPDDSDGIRCYGTVVDILCCSCTGLQGKVPPRASSRFEMVCR